MSRSSLSHGAAVDVVDLFTKQLKQCRVTARDTVLVYGDTLTPPHRLAACLAAAQHLGAQAVEMVVSTKVPEVLPFGPRSDQIRRGLVLQAWKSADLVVDMVTASGQGFSQVMEEATRSGTRVLRVIEPDDVLSRLMATPELISRTLAGGEIMSRGKLLHVTSPAGTDITFDKTGRPAMLQYGLADEPGRWDHWPSGAVACAPLENSAKGILVIAAGDVILPLGSYASEPIKLIVEDGRITDIQGEGVDAILLRSWFSSWSDPNAYVVSHVGWGTLKNAQWHRMKMKWAEPGGLCDVEFAWGCVTIAFGSNMGHGFNGRNDSQAHIDFCCLGCDFLIDEELITQNGEIIPEPLR
jgi:2,5-dihydroxypyridine 5,6-dioxygenase